MSELLSLQDLNGQLRSTPKERKLLMALYNGKQVQPRLVRRLARDGWLTESEEGKFSFTLKGQILVIRMVHKHDATKKANLARRAGRKAGQGANIELVPGGQASLGDSLRDASLSSGD